MSSQVRYGYIDEIPESESKFDGAWVPVDSISGVRVRWFRPPYGSQTPLTLVMFGERWLPVAPVFAVLAMGGVFRTLGTVSYWIFLAKALAGARPGGILLAHDGFAGLEDAADDGPPALADRAGLLGEVLDRYHEAGLRGRSLGEALHGGRAVRAAVFSVKQL